MQDYTAETWIQAAEDETPTSLRLLPARPNPSSRSFQIRHYVPRRGSFRLTVVDAQGRTVRVLTNRELLPGWYDSRWDGRDAAGRNAGSGTYFVRFEGMGAVETKKLVLMR
jgi:flagellar hook assembly protein FlgD